MRKAIFFCFLLRAVSAFCQEPSDYYNKPLKHQELRQRSGICTDTVVSHGAGFRQCFQEMYRWIDKNKDKYNFISVATAGDSGIVQATLPLDCSAMHNEPASQYYLVLASSSASLKISFEEIQTREKDCRAGLRKSIRSEIIQTVQSLPDSVEWNKTHPPRGLCFPESVVTSSKTASKSDSSVARIFETIRADSARVADSTRRVFQRYDSIARADSLALARTTPPLDTAAVQEEMDSIMAVAAGDSIHLRGLEAVLFKKQPTVLNEKKINVATRLECLRFFRERNLRPDSSMAEYLAILDKYCSDKQNFYYSLRKLLDEEQKYRCTRFFMKCQEDHERVGEYLSKIAR